MVASKAIPVQTWTGLKVPGGCGPYPPHSQGYISGTHSCYRLSRPQCHIAAGRVKSTNFNGRRIPEYHVLLISTTMPFLYLTVVPIFLTLSHFRRIYQLRGQFQNQPLIGWLKKYKKDNKTLLYGTVTYISALLLHIVAIHIKALVP